MLKVAKLWFCRAILVFSASQIIITVLYLVFHDTSLIVGRVNKSLTLENSKIGGRVFYIPYSSNYNGKTKYHKCPELPWVVPKGGFLLENDNRTYYRTIGNLTCTVHGTIFDHLNSTSQKQSCICKPGWFGNHCGIPLSVVNSDLPERFTPKPRIKNPRRIIQAFPFNMEFEMLEARLNEFGDIVDVFMILESNYTAFGDPKDLRLLKNLREGLYKEYACKIVHIFLDYFPEEGYKNGWIEDNLLRNYIVQHGFKQISGHRHDDIFILTDADEIPKRETILFLKLHDGYPEPFGYNYQWNTYGFFWKARDNAVTRVGAGVTVGMLLHIFHDKAIRIRSAVGYFQNEGADDLNRYLNHGNNISVHYWTFGSESVFAGWHCSWCCNPECIKIKLISAQNGDFPRWGNYPAKQKISYITKLIQDGGWFDNVSKMVKVPSDNVSDYAPSFFIKNHKKYSYLLENPYAKSVSHEKMNYDQNSILPTAASHKHKHRSPTKRYRKLFRFSKRH